MSATTIEWTDRTWNFVTGCTKVSSGCRNCYAETIAERFRGGKAFPNGFDIQLRPEKMNDPLKWRKPSRVFVNSMSDFFHPDVPDAMRKQALGVMAQATEHTFQVLSKRPEVMVSAMLDYYLGQGRLNVPVIKNLWLGVSVELARYLSRIELLKQTPAAVRFVSIEPLLNGLDVDQLADALKGIDWVIIGGESGANARPCLPDWIRNCVRAARAAGCAVFVKQMGTWWASIADYSDYKGGEMADWPEDLRIREFPGVDHG